MEVKGAALLYTLATLAVTFAGFAALLVMLRQSAGSALSALDRFLTRTVVSHLSVIAAGALLPPILTLYGLPELLVWKIAAVVFGLPLLAMLFSYGHRRHAATGKPAPPMIMVVFVGVGALSLVAMIAAIFLGLAPPAAVYTTALTVNFLTLAFAFVVALEVILRQDAKG